MIKRHLSPEKKRELRKRKKLLLWQGEQLKRFKTFVLVKYQGDCNDTND